MPDTSGLPRQIEERAIDESWSDTEIMDSLLDRQGGAIRATRNHVTLDDPQTFRDRRGGLLLFACMSGQEPQGPARSWPPYPGQTSTAAYCATPGRVSRAYRIKR